MQLTQKETGLIKDLKDQEKLCIEKYTKHADAAHDPQLKQLFGQLADVERAHLKAITSIEGGTVPASVCDAPAPNGSFTTIYGPGETDEKRPTPISAPICWPLRSTPRIFTTPASLNFAPGRRVPRSTPFKSRSSCTASCCMTI